MLGGDKIEEIIWQWSRKNTKIFTSNFDMAQRAMSEGLSVVAIKPRPKIVKY